MHVHLARAVMEFRVLGPLAVHVGGRVVELGGLKQRMLLALLLIRANEPVGFDYLIDALWESSPPARARNTLQVYVSRLRKVLEWDRITTSHGGYSLVVESGELDLGRFRALVEEGRDVLADGDPSAASDLLTQALSLWHGSPLPEFCESRVFAVEIARLEEERLAALEDRIAADLDLRRHSEVVPELDALVTRHPLRERFVAQLMLALYRSGRQAEALETYRAARRRLVEGLGLDPGAALNELHQQILVQDPTLEPVGRPRPPASRPSRRRLTLLLAGLSLPGRADPEVAARILTRAREAVRDVLRQHEVVVEEPLGDIVVGAFGLPASHEHDPLHALRVAGELPRVLAESEVSLRIAIDTGNVLATDDRLVDDQIAGWMMQLKEAAREGDVVLGEGTRRLVGGAVELQESRTPGAWKVVSFDPSAEAIERRFDVPLVGRDAEIARLREAFAWVGDTRSAHLLTVLGAAGIGKSRLALEFANVLAADARVLVGRCLEYGSGAFWPLAEMVRSAAGETTRVALERLLSDVDDSRLVVDQLTAALGREQGASAEDAFWAFRRLFAALARDRPLVLVFEDLHWAEERLLDFVEELVEWGEGASILVLCLARPELLDERPSWGGGRLDAESIRLDPLSASGSEALIESLDQQLSEEARRSILGRAEGNPLFIEQMVALFEEDPDMAKEAVPPSIQAVLAARLDRLAPDERAVLERASVIGLEFSIDAVANLSVEAERADVGDIIRRLVRKELVRPALPEIPGGEFRFRHILIRDTAYGSVLKETRAELHEQFAAWLEQTVGLRATEVEEVLGYHLEQAYLYRRELDASDDCLPELAARAGELLAAAGRRARARSDMRAATGLLSRALALLPTHHRIRGDLFADLAAAFRLSGQWPLALKSLEEGRAAALAHGDRALHASLVVDHLQHRMHTEPDLTVEDLLMLGSRALHSLTTLKDQQRAGRVLGFLAWCYALSGRAEEAERMVTAVSRMTARDDPGASNLLPSLWLYGPLPVQQAATRCEALMERDSSPRTVASCLRCLAVLKAMVGRFDDARSLAIQAEALVSELGLEVIAAASSTILGTIELLKGDAASSEEILRNGFERLSSLGETMYSSELGVQLARALYAQQRDEEAWQVIQVGARATVSDVAVPVYKAGIRAKLLARRGVRDESIQLAHEAIEIAERTDFIDLQGDALMDLAEVLRFIDDFEKAHESASAALDLYHQKGNLVSARRARAFVAGL
jgi:DNA-binding SARP family transcriptional activator/tetratricopeptide (TPR) repeat protein